MSDEEVDEELVQLRETKHKLLGEAIKLRKEFEDWDKNSIESTQRNEKYFISTKKKEEFHNLFTRNNNNDDVTYTNKKCVAISGYIMGVKFNDIDKKWISENKYLYSTHVKTKVLEFHLEVTVYNKDKLGGLEILNIDCDIINARKCYSLEINPWVHRFSESKNTHNLFSAISDYTEHNITRRKILKALQEYNIVSVQEYTEDDGGIMIYLHSKNDRNLVYFEIKWVLKFVDSLWGIDNFFFIDTVSVEKNFLKENDEIFQNFCKYKIKNDDLQDLWQKLCSAVEQYSISESTTESSSS